MIVVTPEGADPDDERWFDHFSDDELVEAFVDAGHDRSYGEYVVDVLRGRTEHEGP